MEQSCSRLVFLLLLSGASCSSSVVVLCVWLELPYKGCFACTSSPVVVVVVVFKLKLWLSESVEERKLCWVPGTEVGADIFSKGDRSPVKTVQKIVGSLRYRFRTELSSMHLSIDRLPLQHTFDCDIE